MQYIEYILENGENVIFETRIESGDVFEDVDFGDTVSKVGKSIKDVVSKIRPIMKEVVEGILDEKNCPDELEVEFGVALSASMGAIITSSQAEANFKVKTLWKKGD